MTTYHYDPTKHDIGIVRTNGDEIGLMLAQRNGVPIYSVDDVEILAQQWGTGDPGYGWFRPTEEFPLIGDDWRSGFGLDVFDSDDPKRYLTSTNFDLRFKGMGIAGPKATAVTLPTTTDPTITDAGLEAWTTSSNLTSWTEDTSGGASEVAQESTIKNAGSYSAKLISDTGSTDYAQIYQDLATTQIQGRRFTLTAYLRLTNATNSQCKIGINDGVTTTWSRKGIDATAFEAISITKTLSQAATRLRIICYAWDATNAASGGYFDTISITRNSYGYPTVFEDFNNVRYIGFSGGLLGKVNSGTTAVTGVYEFASPITSMKVFRDGYMYIALESTQIIENCEDDWTDGTHGSSDLDTGDYKVGSGSVKITGASVVAGDILAYEDITSLDLQAFTGITLWIKSSATVAEDDLKLALDNTAACASPVVSIGIPALTAGQWAKVYAKATMSSCTAIISVGLEYNANAADTTIRLDDIRAESAYYYMDTGETVTQSTLSNATHDSFAKYFQPVGTTMWKCLPPNNIYSATDPSNIGAANWSAVTTVDTPSNNITGLVSDGTSLYIPKEDRCFYLDSAGAVKVLIGETEHITASTSGKNTVVWKGKTYYPCGDQSLVEYDAGTITWRSPALYCTNLSAFNNRVQALAGDNQWLHAILDNDTEVEVLAGRLETINGTTGWVWHPIVQLTLAGCETAHISGIGKKALWIASTSSSDSLCYVLLYTGYGDPVNDTNKNFQTGGEFETPWLHGDFKGDNKDWVKITLTMEDTTSTVYFEAHYKRLGDASWTDIGDFKTSPTTSKFIPVDVTDSENPVSKWIKFKFVAVCTTSATPVLKAYDIRAILKPSKRSIIRCVVRCADNITGKDDKDIDLEASDIRATLIEAKNATWPVTIYDPWGDTKTVQFLPTAPFRQIIKDEKGRNIEEHYNLSLQEVTLS